MPKPKIPRTSTTQYGLVVATPDCGISYLGPVARPWLPQFFDSPDLFQQLPREICDWLKGGSLSPLVVKHGKARLVVRRYRPHPRHVIALLLEHIQPGMAAASRTHTGLTRRETEIWAWLAAGKENPEIAQIMGIARGTVGKHLERIFVKLGVENRTAAANIYNAVNAEAA